MNLLGEPLSYDFWQAKVYYLYEIKKMIGTARANVRIRRRAEIVQIQITSTVTRIIPIRTDKGKPQEENKRLAQRQQTYKHYRGMFAFLLLKEFQLCFRLFTIIYFYSKVYASPFGQKLAYIFSKMQGAGGLPSPRPPARLDFGNARANVRRRRRAEIEQIQKTPTATRIIPSRTDKGKPYS